MQESNPTMTKEAVGKVMAEVKQRIAIREILGDISDSSSESNSPVKIVSFNI